MVWGVDFEGGERTVDIHIRRLRAKMPPQAADLLETRRGIGYGLRVLMVIMFTRCVIPYNPPDSLADSPFGHSFARLGIEFATNVH